MTDADVYDSSKIKVLKGLEEVRKEGDQEGEERGGDGFFHFGFV